MARNDKNNEKIVTLKPKEELEFLKIAKFGSGKQKEAALMSLIYYNQNLVKYIVKGYSYLQGQVDHEDLIAEGTIALAKAIDKFDVNSKNRFATYAGYWIRQYIQSFIHKDQLINQPTDQKKQKDENDLDSDQNGDSKFVRERFNVIYYDREYQSGDKDNKSYSLVDILSEGNDNIDKQIHKSDIKVHVNDLLSSLESLEDLTVRLYYGIIPISLNQVYHISNEKEKEELNLLMESKLLKKKKIAEIRVNQKEVRANHIVKKYVKLFEKTYKTKEISEIIGKAEGIVRKLKQKALKKMKVLGESRNLDSLI
ncbi:MAG: RNA polymerase sigma factor RpoS [Mycoplasmataceae bacterium]|nr:MAG: RNA polymerase sigma factor RpoS [Mycoplasmataceae bacterium]